ncbi:MAG: type VI secretion system-associated FHA domain protein TagH [Rhodospirillales bacterium]
MTLRIRQESGLPAGQAERKLGHGRLVLGRGAESDWVLTDPARTISKRHCVIEDSELGYEITDLSTNGVFLNDDEEPVGVGNSRRLRHGDRIRLGPYSFSVEVSAEEQPASLDSSPLGLSGSFDSVTELFREGAAAPGADELFAEGPTFKPPRRRDPEQGPPIDEFFSPQPGMFADTGPGASASQPPSSATSLFGTPEEWAKAAAAMIAPMPAPLANAPAPPPSPSSPTPTETEAALPTEVVAAFCAGAGLDPSVLAGGSPAQTMNQAGEVLRIAIAGLMAVLNVRRTVKNEFRLSATEFRPVENNPLKFSVDLDSAMQMLLGKPQRGFLPAKEAVGEAVDDLRMHEIAILAGVQAAWLNLLQRFDPRDLSHRLQDDSALATCWARKSTLLGRVRYALREHRRNTGDEWQRTFQDIFGATNGVWSSSGSTLAGVGVGHGQGGSESDALVASYRHWLCGPHRRCDRLRQ